VPKFRIDPLRHLVVGRPIVHSDDPTAMARRIIADMKAGD
jgi:orotidine-5'-phosphate decarboxylase